MNGYKKGQSSQNRRKLLNISYSYIKTRKVKEN